MKRERMIFSFQRYTLESQVALYEAEGEYDMASGLRQFAAKIGLDLESPASSERIATMKRQAQDTIEGKPLTSAFAQPCAQKE